MGSGTTAKMGCDLLSVFIFDVESTTNLNEDNAEKML